MAILTRPRVQLAAAVLAAALALAALESRRRSAQEPPIGKSRVPANPTNSLRLAAPLGDLTRIPAEFTWQAVPGAAKYSVVLMEVDRSELWIETTDQTGVVLPAGVRNRIVDQKTLLWKVTALDAKGERLLESETGRFRLGPGE